MADRATVSNDLLRGIEKNSFVYNVYLGNVQHLAEVHSLTGLFIIIIFFICKKKIFAPRYSVPQGLKTIIIILLLLS